MTAGRTTASLTVPVICIGTRAVVPSALLHNWSVPPSWRGWSVTGCHRSRIRSTMGYTWQATMSEQLHAGCHAALEAQAVDFRAALARSGSGRQPTRWSALSSGICWRRE